MNAKGTKVLVVDDDTDTCANLHDILTDLGYHVDTAHDGPAALELVKASPYDVAILDLRMPGMDGLTLYREIRKLRADAVALVVTAFVSDDAEAEAMAAGVWQVLNKPIDLRHLRKLLDEAADQPLLMLVDDDAELCASLWDLLREKGYRVAIANDADSARRCVLERTFHAVLIDLKLPAGDGSDVFRLVREASPTARTVLITGHRAELENVVHQVVEEGADAVCFKPFDMPMLLATLKNLTAR